VKKLIVYIVGPILKTYWFIFRPETHGVKGLVVKDEKVLLVKTTYSKLFTLPGGGIKKAETAKAALIRELAEETGIKVIKCHLVGEYLNSKEYKNDHISLFYIDEFEDGDRPKTLEIDIADFYLLKDLPKSTSPATLRRLKLDPQKVERGKW